MSNAERNKRITREFFEAMSKGDTAKLLAAYHPSVRVYTMGHTLLSGVRTLEEVAPLAAQVLGAFPKGIRFELKNITAEEDRVAVEAESDAVHVSGTPYHNYYHFLVRFSDDGRITEFKEYMDTELVTEILCGGQKGPPPAR
jgi:ketosteroid isomerase-like protein